MTPTDERSPHRQQRWVEVEGSSLAFGDCMEIIGAYRPEQGSVLTPGGGRTVFQVITPTQTGIANTIIIGQLQGQKGYCTNDFPTYAKCDQQVNVGDEVGPIRGSRVLSPRAHGYLVMGDVQDGLARVRRLDVCCGGVGFKLLEDRTRKTDSAGLFFGDAQAVVQDTFGNVPGIAPGDIIRVVFFDRLWLGAVKNCEGIADYYPASGASESSPGQTGDKPAEWIIKACQELASEIWFRTLADRDPSAPEEKIAMDLLDYRGHSNAVFPPGLFLGQFPTVTYDAGEYPWALEDAIGKAELDVDYDNTTSNSGMVYRVRTSDQMMPELHVVHEKFCSSADPEITQWSPAFYHPFSQVPKTAPKTSNPSCLASNGGSGVIRFAGIGGAGGSQCSGNAVWTFVAMFNAWVLKTNCTSGCEPQQDPSDLFFAPPPFDGQEFTTPCIGGEPPAQALWNIVQAKKEDHDILLIDPESPDGCSLLKLKVALHTCEIAVPADSLTEDFLVDIKLEEGSSGADCVTPTIIGVFKKGLVCGPDTTEKTLTLPMVSDVFTANMNMDGCPTWLDVHVVFVGAVCGEAEQGAICEEVCPESGSSS